MKTLWIFVLLLGAAFGFFHIVETGARFTVVPKASFTFVDTFISVHDVIERYNNRNFAEALRGDPQLDSLVRNLEKQGFIGPSKKPDIKSQSSKDTDTTSQGTNSSGGANQVPVENKQTPNSLLPSSDVLMRSAIRLHPTKGDNSLLVEGKTVTGACGSSVVNIVGINKVYNNLYSLDDNGRIFIRSEKSKLLIISDDMRVSTDHNTSVLSDHNGMACVSTQSGDKLLIWSVCGGSACTDGFSFYIIDPEQLVFVAPKDPIKDYCYEECASRLLGNRLPQQLNGSK